MSDLKSRVSETIAAGLSVRYSLTHAPQVMVHACRGLRAAKEGLNQTVLLKALREERDSLAKRLGDCEADLKRIHHSYTEMMNLDMAVG